MKQPRFTHLLTLLVGLMATAATAAVTEPTLTTDASNPVYYAIKNYRSGNYATYLGSSTALGQRNGLTYAALWYFTASGDGVSLVPAVDPSMKQATASSATAEGATWYVKENPYNTGRFCVSLTSDLSDNCWDDQGNNGQIGYWHPSGSDYAGTSWDIEPISAETAAALEADWNSYPVNISKAAGFTNTNRFTTSISLGTQSIAIPTKGLGTLAYRFISDEKFTAYSGTSVAPAIGYQGQWMHGICFIDLNNDGDFDDGGELVSHSEYRDADVFGNVAGTTLPEFTLPATTGTYRMRYMVIWAADGAPDSRGTSSMINNGGIIYDVMLDVITASDEQMDAFAKMGSWLEKTKLVTDASNYISNAKQGDEGSYEALLDNNFSTYFHSAWSGSMAGTAGHDLQVRLPEDIDALYLYYVTRSTGTGYPTGFRIDGSNNAADFSSAGGSTWTNSVATLDGTGMPTLGSQPYSSAKIQLSGSYQYLRFVPSIGNNQGGNWFCLAEFGVYSADPRAEAARAFLASAPTNAADLTDEQIAEINSIDADVTALQNEIANAATRSQLRDLLTEANTIYTEGEAGAASVKVGYPTSAALSTFKTKIDAAQDVQDNGGDYEAAVTELQAAIATVKAFGNTVYTPRTDVYYTITSGRGSMVYDASHSASTDADGNEFLWYSTSLDNTDENHLWGFIERDGKYYMYNVGKRQFANVTQSGSYHESNGDGHTWMFSDAPSAVVLDAGESNWVTAPNVRVRATSEVTGKQYAMSISTSYTGPVIAYDAVNDGGVPMAFALSPVAVNAEVTAAIEALLEDLTPYVTALQEAIDAASGIDTGAGLNQYAASEAFTAALAAARTEVASDEATKESLTAAREALVAATAALTLNQPEAGSFLRIYSVQQGGYVSSTVDASVAAPWNTYFTCNKPQDEQGTIWYYSGTHRLLNYATGLNSGNFTAAEAGDDAGVAFDFPAAVNGTGSYWVHTEENKYWYAGTPTIDNYSNPSAVPNTLFTLSYVESLPVEVTSAGWATLNLPVAVEVPEGVTAYVGKIEGEMLNFSEVGGVLPANTPVILEAAAGTYDFAITDAEGTVEAGYDALVGTIAAQTCEAEEYYTLQMRDGEAGMYPYSGTKLKGFKAFMSTATAAGVRGFAFGGVQTGLSGVETSGASRAAIYDLQGRRVQQGRKGVYVVNGKKVLF
ncbi:MAG: hypothetical protein IJ722_01425 [Alloprevotella sp.]|nr:hypothetical protein [Alloprevotella sp.]